MNYWQIAAGSDSRDYSEDFLKYGMAFVGGQEYIDRIKKVNLGDRIILKLGTQKIKAVGIVIEREGKYRGNADDVGESSKEWLKDFDGWNLPAYCYVEWHKANSPFEVKGLRPGAITATDKQEIKDAADKIFSSCDALEFKKEPEKVEKLKLDEMLVHLISLGLRPSAADELTTTLKRITLLAEYYYHKCLWEDVREHETRTFLIIPFLLALGWSEQQIKIELGVPKGRIDVACFTKPYRRNNSVPNNSDCALILESKGFSQGLDYAHTQGKEYASLFPSCQIVIASNGFCYKAYKRTKDEFSKIPNAYLNLLKPKKQYMRDPNIDGGLKILEYLLPQKWIFGNQVGG
jgi:hypothetical protein